MIFDVLSKNGKFVDAKPLGWEWSERELDEYTRDTTDDLQESDDDYVIEMVGSGVVFAASRVGLAPSEDS